MMRSKVLFSPMLKLELIETYHVKLSTVQGLKSGQIKKTDTTFTESVFHD